MNTHAMYPLAWVSCFVLLVVYSSIVSNPAIANEIQSDIGEAKSASAESTPSKVDIAKAMESRGGVYFAEAYLWEVLEYLTQAYPVPFLIDTAAVYVPESPDPVDDPRSLAEEWLYAQPHYFTDGMFDSIELQGLTLFGILDEICGTLGLTYISEPGYIWISTANPDARAVKPEPVSRFQAYGNEAHMQEKRSLVYEAVHLSQVLESLQKTCGVNLLLDDRVVRPEYWESLWPRTYAIPEGYATDGYIRIIFVKNIEIRDMLKAVLRPLGLTFEARDDVVVILSAARLAQRDILEAQLLSLAAIDKKWSAMRSPVAPVDSSGKPTASIQHYFTLLAIEEDASGAVRARIRLRQGGSYYGKLGFSTGAIDYHKTTYSEGDVLHPLKAVQVGCYFEGDTLDDFQLIRIDTAAGCCTIFDEELGREVEICLPPGK
jgi:hypothetical protein